MVPDAGDDGHRTDGGLPDGMDEGTLYLVVRRAVEDAILNVIGTLLLVGVALLVIWVGAMVAVRTPSTAGLVAGSIAILIGMYIGGTTLGVVPSLQRLLRSE